MSNGYGIMSWLQCSDRVIAAARRSCNKMRVSLNVGYRHLRVGKDGAAGVKNYPRDCSGSNLRKDVHRADRAHNNADCKPEKNSDFQNSVVPWHDLPLHSG